MKIWCETCDGTGELDNSTRFEQDTKKCHDCNGKGYTENETLNHEAKVGRATLRVFADDGFIKAVGEYRDEYIDIETIRELIEFAESEDNNGQ